MEATGTDCGVGRLALDQTRRLQLKLLLWAREWAPDSFRRSVFNINFC